MLYVFVGCLAFGAFYAILSLVLGGHGFDHDMDHGGLDLQHDGLELSHDGLAGADHSADSSDGPSLFSPVVIASAITAFGAVGLAAMKGFGMSGLMSTVVALAFAGITGAAIFFGIVKFMYGSQSNSTFSLEELIGTEAEVFTPIPATGMGEVAYVRNGIRYTLTARTMGDESAGRGTTVVIREITGSIAVVQKKVPLDDLDFYQDEQQQRNEKPRSDAGNN